MIRGAFENFVQLLYQFLYILRRIYPWIWGPCEDSICPNLVSQSSKDARPWKDLDCWCTNQSRACVTHWPVQLISKGTHERKEPAYKQSLKRGEQTQQDGKKLRQIGCTLVENIKMGGFPLNSANGIPAPGEPCNLVLRGLRRSFQISPLLLLLQWILFIRCLILGLIPWKEKQGVHSSCLL